MPSWPLTLPDVRYDGYRHFPVVNNVRRQLMTSGRPRQTCQWSHDRQAVEVSWLFTKGEFADFRAFFNNEDVKSGAEYFEVPLVFGQGLQDVNARFLGGNFKHRRLHPHTEVTATLEVEEVPILSEEVLDALIELGESLDEFEDALDVLHIFIHQTFPGLFPA